MQENYYFLNTVKKMDRVERKLSWLIYNNFAFEIDDDDDDEELCVFSRLDFPIVKSKWRVNLEE